MAAFAPLLSSLRRDPLHVSKIRIKVPFSEAVASLVPERLREIQLSGASCALTSIGNLSAFAKSTICTCPAFRDGNTSDELLLFGHKTHRPFIQIMKTKSQNGVTHKLIKTSGVKACLKNV